MGLQALNIGAPEWLTPDGQDDDPAAITRFQVQGLTGSAQARLAPELVSLANGDLVLSAAAVGVLLRFGLVAWENFDDDTGPIEFGTNATANQDRLPYKLQAYLAMRIFQLTRMSADVKKKSS
jgi:hypothetical protein